MRDQWEVSIDTGGTFTDCLARAPNGRGHWIKVLSSGVLRGRITGCRDAGRSFSVESSWLRVDDQFQGFGFRLLDRPEPGPDLPRVAACNATERVIELDASFDREVRPGTLFELISPEPAPLLATRLLTGRAGKERLPNMTMRLGTTQGTNALLTRSGSAPVLFITRGFRDLLEIGTQARPDLFTLNVKKRSPLCSEVVEVAGRIASDGLEIEPLDTGHLTEAAAGLVSEGHRAAAVALLHADRNPAHERRVDECLRRAGFEHVSTSAECSPFIKILTRAETAVVDAYLAPTITAYLERIDAALGEGRLFVMTSAGGLAGVDSYRAKDSLLSGPAGGIVGAAQAGRAAGFSRVIAFDMGGTSTDVARFANDYEYVFEHEVGGARLMAPALAIESVASGGGSVCSYDGIRLNVGPESAGASPGPACYGAGGPLTLTDVNLLLGRLDSRRFEIPIFPEAAAIELERFCHTLETQSGERPEAQELLDGFLEIANQRMADAIRRISLRRGYDPADYALVAFGGAGPQHAVAVAEKLGMRTVLIPAGAAVLSAEGLSRAVVERFVERQILAPLGGDAFDLDGILRRLDAEAVAAVVREGIDAGEAIVRRRIASLRYVGQDAALDVDIEPHLEKVFADRYRQTFGYMPEGRDVEIVSVRVVASSRPPDVPVCEAPEAWYEPETQGTASVCFTGTRREVPVYDREQLSAGARFGSPCLIHERYSTVVVDPGWHVEVDGGGTLVLRRQRDHARVRRSGATMRPEAVRLELFTHRLETIAREMGEALRRTAISTNVKERLDYSCGILDHDGELIVNAPHIPVHLGSLGLCVREVVRALPLEPGDCVVTNHPAFGGSHLPDITLISPVHAVDRRLLGYVASRAHHAELGGMLPGSMAPNAGRLIEEGVVIPPTLLVRGGRARWEELEALLCGAPYPTRALADNLADLRAALAANRAGVVALREIEGDLGIEVVADHVRKLKDHAEAKMRASFRSMADGAYEESEILDDGTRLHVRVEIRGDGAVIDFSGTDDVHPGNLNATPAVVRSAVIYVLRVLIDEPLPLNEGLMRPVALKIPSGMLNPPFPDDPRDAPAVVGGNVETSQRLVNALVRALGLAASSQGTMNNVVFGTETQSYYETICGGCGAGPSFHGASAVHSHMTNTRITDPEVIEHRYPARVERFGVRHGSGGDGHRRGGDGAVREFCFLEPMSVSILSQHRRRGPAGLHGGKPGSAGRQVLIRVDGTKVLLGGADSIQAKPGDRLIIETPGGGGYGKTRD